MPLATARGVVAGRAAADHDDVGRADAGHAAHQHAAAARGLHQVIRADLRGEPAGDLAHRRQQRQRAVGGLHGFVRDRGDARAHQRVGAGLRRGQVQVGEQCLAPAHQLVFGLDGLLDFQQQIGLFPDVLGAGDDLGARRLEVGVGD